VLHVSPNITCMDVCSINWNVGELRLWGSAELGVRCWEVVPVAWGLLKDNWWYGLWEGLTHCLGGVNIFCPSGLGPSILEPYTCHGGAAPPLSVAVV
jgi:hypothetical protein